MKLASDGIGLAAVYDVDALGTASKPPALGEKLDGPTIRSAGSSSASCCCWAVEMLEESIGTEPSEEDLRIGGMDRPFAFSADVSAEVRTAGFVIDSDDAVEDEADAPGTGVADRSICSASASITFLALISTALSKENFVCVMYCKKSKQK